MRKCINYDTKLKLIEDVLFYSITDKSLDPYLFELCKVVFIAYYYADNKHILNEENSIDLIETYNCLMNDCSYYNDVLSKINKYELESLDRMFSDRINQECNPLVQLLDLAKDFNAEKLLKELKEFDINKYEEVANIVKKVNEV